MSKNHMWVQKNNAGRLGTSPSKGRGGSAKRRGFLGNRVKSSEYRTDSRVERICESEEFVPLRREGGKELWGQARPPEGLPNEPQHYIKDRRESLKKKRVYC